MLSGCGSQPATNMCLQFPPAAYKVLPGWTKLHGCSLSPTAWGVPSLLTSEALCAPRGELYSWAVDVIQASCVSARTEAENVLAQSQTCLTRNSVILLFHYAGVQRFDEIQWENKAAHTGMERGQPAQSREPKAISRKCVRRRQVWIYVPFWGVIPLQQAAVL